MCTENECNCDYGQPFTNCNRSNRTIYVPVPGDKGNDGNIQLTLYAKNNSNINPPVIEQIPDPTGWSIEPPELLSNEFRWVSVGIVNYDRTILVSNWSNPVLHQNIVTDATSTVKGIIRLSGDLAGTADNPTVPNKVDKVAGKQLSDENYTLAEKTKLSGLEERFQGVYPTYAQLVLEADTGPGYTADVDEGIGTDVKRYIWDVSDGEWVLGGGSTSAETPFTIKTKYESNLNTNAFTDIAEFKVGSIIVHPEYAVIPEYINGISDSGWVTKGNSKSGTISLFAPEEDSQEFNGIFELQSDAWKPFNIGTITYHPIMIIGNQYNPIDDNSITLELGYYNSALGVFSIRSGTTMPSEFININYEVNWVSVNTKPNDVSINYTVDNGGVIDNLTLTSLGTDIPDVWDTNFTIEGDFVAVDAMDPQYENFRHQFTLNYDVVLGTFSDYVIPFGNFVFNTFSSYSFENIIYPNTLNPLPKVITPSIQAPTVFLTAIAYHDQNYIDVDLSIDDYSGTLTLSQTLTVTGNIKTIQNNTDPEVVIETTPFSVTLLTGIISHYETITTVNVINGNYNTYEITDVSWSVMNIDNQIYTQNKIATIDGLIQPVKLYPEGYSGTQEVILNLNAPDGIGLSQSLTVTGNVNIYDQNVMPIELLETVPFSTTLPQGVSSIQDPKTIDTSLTSVNLIELANVVWNPLGIDGKDYVYEHLSNVITI